MNLGKRLAYAFQLCGTSAPNVSRATGVPVASINALIRRDSDKSTYASQLIGVLNPTRVNIDWVVSGRGDPEPVQSKRDLGPVNGLDVAIPDSPKTSVQTVHLPRLGVAAIDSAEGRKFFAAAIDSQTLELPYSWLPANSSTVTGLCWSEMLDDDMTRVIPKGSRYVINKNDKGGVVGERGLFSILVNSTGKEQARYLTWNTDSSATIEASSELVRKQTMPTHDFMIVGRVLMYVGQPLI